mgnify:CR=1 FL=1
MDNADKALMSNMRRKGVADTSEAQRTLGGGRVPMASELGFMTPTVAPTPQPKEPPSAKPKERDTYYDASEYFKRLDAQRARNRRGRNRRSGGGGVGGGGVGGGGGGDSVNPFGGFDKLEQYEGAQTADYKKSGENFFKSQQPENLRDFQRSEAAQTEFAQNAALRDFMRLDANAEGELLPQPFNIGGQDYDVFTFEDGSEFILFDDADIDDLRPGDVLRINPPELKGKKDR